MKRTILPGWGGLFVMIVSVGVACGGGGDAPSLEEYFQRVDEAQNAYGAASDAGANRFPLALQDIEQTEDAFSFSASNTTKFRDALRDLEAPDEVRAVQDDAVAALEQLAGAQRAAADELKSVEDADQMQQVLDAHRADSDEAFARLDEACREAQAIADANGIDVDLECGEEGGPS